MKWTFERVQLKGFPDMPSEWVLKVTSIPQLFEFHEQTRPAMIADAFEDFKVATSRLVQRDHFTNHLAQTTHLLASASGDSFVISLASLLDKVDRQQVSSLAHGKVLYIRDIGSYMVDDGTRYTILDSYEIEELIFPQSHIRLIKWENGTHWYAKIGNIDVVVNDEQKWNTKSAARKAAMFYLSQNWKPERAAG